jgi:Amt family ammonium transporter
MAADAEGMLGVIRFVDFDRLSVFDPSQGHELLAAATVKLRAMLPSNRLIAHVDRAHVGIWFGADVDEASAQIELDAIVYALGEALPVGGRPVLPEVKVQLARLDGGDPAVLLARALARLVVADTKAAEACVASDDEKAESERFALEQDLRRAVAANELQLRYQPLIDADAGVCGAEALIRWRHQERGMIAPSRFVPLLEAAGLAHEIGLWVINTACREARNWKTAELPQLQVAVNVSAYQLERADLPQLVARTLERHALEPGGLEIELTESAALGDCEHARALFTSLRDLGVRIAIDDFGTGYSTLSTLRSLAFDKIKIDREFVSQVDTQRESQAICQSIIALGRGLGISVLAEGVERAEEYLWLRRHGCRKFQGYFFSPPLEGPAFVGFVRNREQLMAKLETGPNALKRELSERMYA